MSLLIVAICEFNSVSGDEELQEDLPKCVFKGYPSSPWTK